MKPERIVVRRATESDLPNIERQYGTFDNVGDPFCDTSKLTKIRYDHLLVAEVDGIYAGFLYWHIGKKTVLRSTSYTIRPHPRSSGPEKIPPARRREETDPVCIAQVESARNPERLPCNRRDQ